VSEPHRPHRPCLLLNKPPSSRSYYYGSTRPGTYHRRLFNLLRSPSVSSKSSFATSLSSTTQAAPTQSVDITRDVALKAILKKKVKGNEENVWSEMRVLRGLDHPNVVRLMSPRAIYLPSFLTPCFFRCKSDFTTGSSRGQDTTAILSSPWAERSLNASASADTSQCEMPWRCFGPFGRFIISLSHHTG
jgi:hypothetical protein